jgi:8-oxo-dGTP pyrophosphatase MutT (NUDIX family)
VVELTGPGATYAAGMTTPPAVVERTGARVLVVDDLGRVLLLRGSDPAVPDAPTWWITPGGGADPGESAPEAARRELAEETGLVLDELGAPVWTRTAEFDFLGSRYRQAETFFLARVQAYEPDTSGWTEIERAAVHEVRWWDLAELERSGQTVYPSTLVPELRLLLARGRPAQPKVVGP